MSAVVYYLATLAVYFIIYNILVWGLNIQFGFTGILNFTYITFMAISAYFTGVTGLGPPNAANQEQYILGLGWHFPFTLLAGTVAAGLLALLVGAIALRRLRSDYLAIVTVALGSVVFDIVGNDVSLFNGQDGISGVNPPLEGVLNLNYNTYMFFFIGLSLVIMLIMWWIASRIYDSPFGRTLRAIREDPDVAEAFGKNTFRYQMIAFVVGCMFAGVAGALTIEFIGSFNPSGWQAGETFVIWAALLLGGRGNNKGAILGALLVPVVFSEATRFLPAIPGHPALIEALRNVVIGFLLIATLWFLPNGILPEQRPPFYQILLRSQLTGKEAQGVVGG